MAEVENVEKEKTVPEDTRIEYGPRYNLVPIEFSRSNKNRVKLYISNESSMWDDAGTGHVAFSKRSEDGSPAMVFRLESSDENRLESLVKKEGLYQKQQETLLMWTEETTDIALSFQEETGCDAFYAQLGEIMGKEPNADIAEIESDDFLSDGEVDEMPPLQISRLFELEFYLKKHFSSPNYKDKIAKSFESQAQISNLVDIFHMLEELEDMKHLKALYNIVRSLIMLNWEPLLKLLFDDENLHDVIGMLEYEPSRDRPAKHRDFLYKQARFREVLPIANDELRANIHKVYRIQFIKDQCMPPPSIFEQSPTAALSAYLKQLRAQICLELRRSNFIGELISELKRESLAQERRRDLMLLFTEFMELSLAPGNNEDQRDMTFSSFFTNDVIAASYPCVSLPDPAVQMMAVETIFKLVAFDSATVVEYLRQQGTGKAEGETLTARLALLIFADRDPHLSMGFRVVEIFRQLLAPDVSYPPEQERFLSNFYDDVVPCFIPALFGLFEGGRLKKDSYHSANTANCAVSLLMICVQRHIQKNRHFLLNKDLIGVLLGLLQSKHHFLAANAVRLLRHVISTKDAFLCNHIVRRDHFRPVVECLRKQRLRNNMLMSVLLELFEFTIQEGVKYLLDYLVRKHGSVLEELLGSVFQSIRKRYDKEKVEEEKRKTELMNEAEEKWFDENYESPTKTEDRDSSPETFVERPKADSNEETSVFTASTLRPKTIARFQIQPVVELPSKETSKEAVKEEVKPLVDYGDSDTDDDEEKEGLKEPDEEKPASSENPATPRPAFRGSKRSAVEWEEKENQTEGAKKPCN